MNKPPLDVAGFNQFQKEVMVIDANMNGVIDPEDPAIAIAFAGFERGERVDYENPRYAQLRENYRKALSS